MPPYTQVVHQLLSKSCAKAALARFPLLAHQLPVVKKFKWVRVCGGGRVM